MLHVVGSSALASNSADERSGSRVRVAAIGDLHCGRTAPEVLHALLQRAAADADLLLLCGDLVDHGLPDEARALARELANIGTPTLAVLGNHDVEAGKEAEICGILTDVGVRVLDGDSCVVRGVGIAGVKGFAGGFGAHALGAWGEAAIKAFVHEAVQESLKLEAALSRLPDGPRLALLHYAPIAATLEGESAELFPFLGSSRLEEPINRFGVDLVFHGHAHNGAPEGRTGSGIPVFNVSMPVLERAFPDHTPVRVVEIAVPHAEALPPVATTAPSVAEDA